MPSGPGIPAAALLLRCEVTGMNSMWKRFVVATASVAMFCVAAVLPVRAVDQAMPDKAPVAVPTGAPHSHADEGVDHEALYKFYKAQNRTEFNQKINIEALRLLYVQHRNQV